ncbi:MAG: hypothetical protein HY721_08105 [Planctomycetes bacterium]|nr:hypothetical protein [Planctomycetota bacterium]
MRPHTLRGTLPPRPPRGGGSRSVLATAWLLALGLLSPFVLPGCGGPESLSDRKRRSEAALEELDELAEPAGAAAAEPGAEPDGDDLSLEDLDAPGGEGDREGSPNAPAAEEPAKPAKREAPARTARREAGPRAEGREAREARGSGAGAEDAEAEARLDELRRDQAIRRQEARYHVAKGDELFNQNLYAEAVKAYRDALDRDPTLDATRERLHQAETFLDERAGTVEELTDELRAEQDVRGQQVRLEIQRNVTDGEKALEAGDFAKAEEHASNAVDSLALQTEYDPALKARATDLLKRAREESRKQREASATRLREEADLRAQQEQAHEAKVKYNQVQELLRKTSEFLRQEDYPKAIEACTRVLEIEPENRVAKFWLADAKDQLLRERRARLVRDRIDATKRGKEGFLVAQNPQDTPFDFPEGEEWELIRRRGATFQSLRLEDPEPIRRIKSALEVQVDLSFDKTPLADVVQQLRTVTGAKIIVDPAIDAQSQTVTGDYRGLSASNVLNLILENVGLSYVFKESVLFITNAGQKAGTTEFAIYNVSDILNKIRDFQGPELILRAASDQQTAPISFTAEVEEEESQLEPESLVQLVQDSTGGEEAWAEPNTIEFHAGQFLVNATRELHEQIQMVLANLRKDSDLFVVIEARFIDVNDDFLEDIGIDSRSLGIGNNYGTPFGNIINDARTGGQDLGAVKQGSPVRDVTLIMGQDRWAGRVRHIIDGFAGAIRGERLTAGNGISGLTLQSTWLEPFQINTILRAVQEKGDVRQLTAPVVTAHNGQRVFVSVITQRAYIADYNLVSGGTGFAIIEVADPEVQTFQEGVILDVDPVISHDKRYVTLDVRPTLATLIGGVISTILVSLGSFTNVAFQVPIGVPEISLQQSFTSVTVPNGGTVLLGGFKSLNEMRFQSYLPILGKIPIINNLFRRKSQLVERRSLVILLSVRIVDLRSAEARTFNAE